MKKFLVLFVCAAALSAGSAFALDLPDAIKIPGLTVTGEVKTGLRVDGETYVDTETGDDGKLKEGDNIATDPYVYAYSDNIDDGTPFRARLTLVWTREKLGVKTQFQYAPDKEGILNNRLAMLNNTVNKAFVYANLFDNKAKLSLGKGTDEVWNLPWSNFSNDASFDAGVNGVKLEVKPIDGLNIGAAYGTGKLFSNAWNNKGTPGFTDQTGIADVDEVRKFIVGAEYKTDNLKVTLALLANIWGVNDKDFGLDYTAIDPDTGAGYFQAELFRRNINNPFKGTSNLLIGASFTPIAPLTVNFAGAITGLGAKTPAKAYDDENDVDNYYDDHLYKDGKFNPYWIFMPKLNGEFAVNDALSVGLTITDWYFADEFYNKKTGDDDVTENGQGLLFPITFNPYVAYVLNDDITAQLDLNLKINHNGSDRFGFGLKPSATFDLGSGATFVVYDEITFYGKSKAADDDDFKKDHAGAAGAARSGVPGDTPYAYTTNILQFDFVWTF
jgi:hypothetical protein